MNLHPLFTNIPTDRESADDVHGMAGMATSDLTTPPTGDTPKPPGCEASIKALLEASDEAAYNLALAYIPQEHKIKVGLYWYVKYAPYRSKKEVKTGWYWDPKQGEELIRISPGTGELLEFCYKY